MASSSRVAESCPAVEAIPICTTLFVLQFIIAFSPGLAANSIRVGNLLGEGRPREARFCAGVAWCMQVGIQAVLVTTILTFRESIASLFVDDPEVRAPPSSVNTAPWRDDLSCFSTPSCMPHSAPHSEC